MTPDALFAWMTRHTATAPVCGLCLGASGHPPIPDDGALVCYPCLYKRGHWAAAPDTLSIDQATALWEAHGDVLELARCPVHDKVEWRWWAA